MKHLTGYNESDNVSNFKKLYNDGDYKGAGSIVLSGWGNNRKPLDNSEIQEIDEFIQQSMKDKQNEYNNVLRGLTGTFS